MYDVYGIQKHVPQPIIATNCNSQLPNNDFLYAYAVNLSVMRDIRSEESGLGLRIAAHWISLLQTRGATVSGYLLAMDTYSMGYNIFLWTNKQMNMISVYDRSASCNFRRAFMTRSSCRRISSSLIWNGYMRGCSGFRYTLVSAVINCFGVVWPIIAFVLFKCRAVAIDCNSVLLLISGPTGLIPRGNSIGPNSVPSVSQARRP